MREEGGERESIAEAKAESFAAPLGGPLNSAPAHSQSDSNSS